MNAQEARRELIRSGQLLDSSIDPLQVPCRECGAPVGEYCVLPYLPKGSAARFPHTSRVRQADRLYLADILQQFIDDTTATARSSHGIVDRDCPPGQGRAHRRFNSRIWRSADRPTYELVARARAAVRKVKLQNVDALDEQCPVCKAVPGHHCSDAGREVKMPHARRLLKAQRRAEGKR